MARSFLTAALSAVLAASAAIASEPPSDPPPAPPLPPAPPGEVDLRSNSAGSREGARRPPPPPLEDGGLVEKFKKRLEKMNGEEREHFLENWKRWKEMGEGEKKDWQKRTVAERERVKKIIDGEIARLGLSLDRDQREVFALRYHQERRKIEQQLCGEMNEKRKVMTADMLQRLKTEFSAAKSVSAPEPVPTATPVPFGTPE